MRIRFTKLSDERHEVQVVRDDGTGERVVLASKDFLRHDLAHLAVETELGLERAVWGSVAQGGSLEGEGLDGPDVALAESVAGRMQTAMRTEATPEQIAAALRGALPDEGLDELAVRLHRRLRQLSGHWRATGYGAAMELRWPLEP